MVVPANITGGTPSDTSVVHASQDGSPTNSRSHDERGISRLQSAANVYSASKTSYDVGDLVIESNTLFRNIIAVTSPEAFDPDKWEAIPNVNPLTFPDDSTQASAALKNALFGSLRTIVFDKEFESAEEAVISDITFKRDDGLKMWVVGSVGTVFEYDLGTAWDSSSAVITPGGTFNPAGSAPVSITWGKDGEKFYVTDSGSNDAKEYDAATPYTVVGMSTTPVGSVSPPVLELLLKSVEFHPSGKILYLTGQTTPARIYQFNLTTAWELDTATDSGIDLSVNVEDPQPIGVKFTSDGFIMYLGGNVSDALFEFHMTKAWDLANARVQPTPFNLSDAIDTFEGFYVRDGATQLYAVGGDDEVHQYGFGIDNLEGNSHLGAITSHNIITDRTYQYQDDSYQVEASFPVGNIAPIEKSKFNQSFPTVDQTTGPGGVFWKPDGTKMFVTGNNNFTIFEYDVSVPFDVSTAVVGDDTIVTVGTQPTNTCFSLDGLHLYVPSNNAATIEQYDLPEAWDLDGAVLAFTLDMPTAVSAVRSCVFRPDGLIMLVGNAGNGGRVHEFLLGEPFELSTAKVTGVIQDIPDTIPFGIFVRNDGKKLYVNDTAADTVKEFDLFDPWNITSLQLASTLDLAASTNSLGLFLKPDTLKFYMPDADPAIQGVTEFDLPLISSGQVVSNEGVTTIEVFTENNFPAAVSNVITLTTGNYIIKDSFTMTPANRIEVPSGASVTVEAEDLTNTTITTDLTGSPLFTMASGAVALTVKVRIDLTNNNAELYNIQSGEFIVDASVATFTGDTSGVKKLGVINNGFSFVLLRNAEFSGWNTGWEVQGTGIFLLLQSIGISDFTGTSPFIDFTANSVNLEVLADESRAIIGGGQAFFSIDPTNITPIRLLNNTLQVSTIFYEVGGLDQTATNVTATGNIGSPDSMTRGTTFLRFANAFTTSGMTQDTPFPIAGITWQFANLEGTSVTDGVLQILAPGTQDYTLDYYSTIQRSGGAAPPLGYSVTVLLSGGGATATATIDTGSVVDPVVIDSGGGGWHTVPTVTFTGGSPTITATGTANVTGGVISIEITAAGTAYVDKETLTIAGGTGTGVEGIANVTAGPGPLESVTITNRGTGYTPGDTFTLTGVGTGATGDANVNGIVTSITLTNAGTDYSSAPDVVFGTISAEDILIANPPRAFNSGFVQAGDNEPVVLTQGTLLELALINNDNTAQLDVNQAKLSVTRGG